MIERARGLDIACHAILIAGAALTCLPIYFTFVAGTLSLQEVQQVPLPMTPGNQFFANAGEVWEKIGFGRLLLNSTIVAVGITVGKIAISLLSAFAIAYFRFPFRKTAFWLIFVSLMLPVEVRIVPTFEAVTNVFGPLQWLFQWIGGIEVGLEWDLLDTYEGLILPLIASASATFLFRQFFLTVPDEICEAARIDGTGPLRFFRDILLPLSMPNIAALSIIFFLYGWNQYLWPLLFTTEPDMATVVIGIKQLVPRGESIPAWNLAMNAAILAMLPPILVVVGLQRWFIKGLVDSGK